MVEEIMKDVADHHHQGDTEVGVEVDLDEEDIIEVQEAQDLEMEDVEEEVTQIHEVYHQEIENSSLEVEATKNIQTPKKFPKGKNQDLFHQEALVNLKTAVANEIAVQNQVIVDQNLHLPTISFLQ